MRKYLPIPQPDRRRRYREAKRMKDTEYSQRGNAEEDTSIDCELNNSQAATRYLFNREKSDVGIVCILRTDRGPRRKTFAIIGSCVSTEGLS